MAIYHLEAKVVSRGAGRSACAASAYLSCSAIYNDYDGVQHDYTRKGGLVWEQIFLPEYAPQEWQDRAILWNAVEENEKTKDSRLAREFVPALPVELTINLAGLTLPEGAKAEGFNGQPEEQNVEIKSEEVKGNKLILPPYAFKVIAL